MDQQLLERRVGPSESRVTIRDELQINSPEQEPSFKQESRELLKLVFPVTGTTILEFLPGFVSVLLAGNMDSPNAQHYVDAATISIMLLNVTALSIAMGLASALDTLCSQAYGAKRFDRIGVYFQTGRSKLVLTVVLVPIAMLNAFAEPVLNLLGQNEEVTRLTKDFSRLMLPGLPFLYLYELVRKVLATQNILKPLVIIAVVANVVNVVAGIGLAYHTSLGLNGIAVARSMCNVTLALLLVPYFWWNPDKLTQWWSGWDLKAAFSCVGLFLRIGFPGMLMMAMDIWAFEILTIMAGVLPDSVSALSAHAVMTNVNTTLWTMFYGIAVAASIRIGNCLGANLPKKARLACLASLSMTVALGSVFMVLLYVFRNEVPRLFLSDGDGLRLASATMAFWSLFMIPDGLNAVVQGVYRGAGKQKAAAIVIVFTYYGVGISMSAVLAFATDLGVKGLWLGIGIGILTTMLVLVFLMKQYWEWHRLALEAQCRVEL